MSGRKDSRGSFHGRDSIVGDYQYRRGSHVSTASEHRRQSAPAAGFPPLWSLYNAKPDILLGRSESTRVKPSFLDKMMCYNRDYSCAVFPPGSRLRVVAQKIISQRMFELLVLIIILADCTHLAMGPNHQIENLERVFLGLYIIEAAVKMFAVGVVCRKGSYFSSGWNIMDFSLIIIAFVAFILSVVGVQGGRAVKGLRALRGLRILRTMTAVKGLKVLVASILNSLKVLSEVMFLSIFWLIVFALIGLQLFMGKFKRRCVLNYPAGLNLTDNMTASSVTPTTPLSWNYSHGGDYTSNYLQWVYSEDNWEKKFDWEGDYWLCGNSSGARNCGAGYTCLELADVANPMGGLQNFDTFGDALLATFQLTVLDEWTNVYRKVVESVGPISTLYFIATVFFGSFQLLNTVLALINLSYERELAKAELELSADEEVKKSGQQSTVSWDVFHQSSAKINTGPATVSHFNTNTNNITNGTKPPTGRGKAYAVGFKKRSWRESIVEFFEPVNSLRRDLSDAANNKLFEIAIGIAILANTIIMALEHHNAPEYLQIFIRKANMAFTVVFTMECLLKIIAMGLSYFKNRWNIFDFMIVAFSLFDVLFEGSLSGMTVLRAFRMFRILRLARVWKTMRQLILAISNALPVIANMSLITGVLIVAFALLGMHGLNHHYKQREDGQLPRWRFDGFAHSLSLTFIIFCGEFIEPLYECFDGTDDRAGTVMCLSVIVPIYLIGNLMILNLYISIILSNFGSEIFDKDADKFASLHGKIKDKFKEGWRKMAERFIAKQEAEGASVDPHLNAIVKGGSYISTLGASRLSMKSGMVHSPKDSSRHNALPPALKAHHLCDQGAQSLLVPRQLSVIQSSTLKVNQTRGSHNTYISGELSLSPDDVNRNQSAYRLNSNLTSHQSVTASKVEETDLDILDSYERSCRQMKHPLLKLDDKLRNQLINTRQGVDNPQTELIEKITRQTQRRTDRTQGNYNQSAHSNGPDVTTSSSGRRKPKSSPSLDRKKSAPGQVTGGDNFASMPEKKRQRKKKTTTASDDDELTELPGRKTRAQIDKEIAERLMGVALIQHLAPPTPTTQAPPTEALPISGTAENHAAEKIADTWSNDLPTRSPFSVLASFFRPTQPERPVCKGKFNEKVNRLVLDSESLMNQRILEMLLPKTRRQKIILPKERNLTKSKQYLRQCGESYDNELETGVVQKFTTQGKLVVFEKCGPEFKGLRSEPLAKTKPVPSMEYLETEMRRKRKEDIVNTARADPTSQHNTPAQSMVKLMINSPDDSPRRSITGRYSPGRSVHKPGKDEGLWSQNSRIQNQLKQLDKQLQRIHMPTGYSTFKSSVERMVSTWYFETIILFFIIISTVCLGLEDIHLIERPVLQEFLHYSNIIITVIFIIEMVLRLVAMGIIGYFTNLWCILDFFIVLFSVLDLASLEFGSGTEHISKFRSLRCLRALRPLRVVSRWEGIKVVVNALLISLPSVGNVILICLITLLLFAIIAVNLFGGKLFYCHNGVDVGEAISPTIIPTKEKCLASNLTWHNNFWGFNHVGQAYLFLFGVATFDNWIEAMEAGADAWEVDRQPVEEKGYATSMIFFTVFTLVCSLFMLNLFIGIMIDSFYRMKKQLEGVSYAETLMTDTQRHFYQMLKKLGRAKPSISYDIPKGMLRKAIFKLVTHLYFEYFILLLVMANIIVMCFTKYNDTEQNEEYLFLADVLFVGAFTVECLLKLLALSYKYFQTIWNLFDFIIVLVSIFGAVMESFGSAILPLSPTVLRAVRIFRVARTLRLIKRAQGIRRILLAMLLSMPALFNIGALLLLVVVVYSIIGMQSFMYVKPTDRLNEVFNFQTMGSSMMVMFRMMTGVGWTFVMESLVISPPYCNDTHATLHNGTRIAVPNGECGAYMTTIIFCVTYIIITYQVIVNCYIALILENFAEQNKDSHLLGEEDITAFYETWTKFDPESTQFIKYYQLSDFLDALAHPLRVSKPNNIAISILNINISTGMKVHCLDLLQRLVNHNLTDRESHELNNIPTELLSVISSQYKAHFPEYLDVEVMSTTRELKLTEYAIKKIQIWWRHCRQDVREKI